MRHLCHPSVFGMLMIIGLAGLISGCASDPFIRSALPPLKNPQPEQLRRNFARMIPDHLICEDTVVINSLLKKTTILGYLRINRQTQSFDLLGLNPAGIQLFLLSCEADKTDIKYAVGPLLDQQDVILALAEDIRRIYFDLLPDKSAQHDINTTQIHYQIPAPTGTIQYIFGGAPVTLLEKRHSRGWLTNWSVRYYNYDYRDGRSYPRDIVFDHHRHHYRIIIKNRAWRHE